MFKKLKRKFILTNLLTSSIVLFIAFSMIYVVAVNAANGRVMRPGEFRQFNFAKEEQAPANNSAASGGPADATNTNSSSDNTGNSSSADSTGFHGDSSSTENSSNDTTTDINNYLNERLSAEREASQHTLLVTLLITGFSVEIIIAIISIYLAEQSVKPVREAYLAQKAFVANASHEIKTPLAVIQANLEAADIKGNHWLDNVEKKVEDLARLNQQLLQLARMDSVKSEIKLEKTDLSALIKETMDFYAPQIAEKGIKLKVSTPKHLEKSINRPDFAQLLNILADNAVKYSQSKITVTLSNHSVSVKNDGATIDKANLPHVFDRFYQTDKTKSGVGLGLAIAKNLADANSWKLSADSDAKSTTFTLNFS